MFALIQNSAKQTEKWKLERPKSLFSQEEEKMFFSKVYFTSDWRNTVLNWKKLKILEFPFQLMWFKKMNSSNI